MENQPKVQCIAAIFVLMSLFLSFSAIFMASRKEQSVCGYRQLDKLVLCNARPQVNIDVTDASLPLPLRGSFCGPVACYGSLTACHKTCSFDVL